MALITPLEGLPKTCTLDVFVSSKDHLDDERLVTREAIASLGMNPILSQTAYWIARPDNTGARGVTIPLFTLLLHGLQ